MGQGKESLLLFKPFPRMGMNSSSPKGTTLSDAKISTRGLGKDKLRRMMHKQKRAKQTWTCKQVTHNPEEIIGV